MNFTPDDISKYSVNHTTQQSVLLEELERKTHLTTIAPQMLSSPLQGRFLSFVSKIKAPSYILEIGTFTGYGTLCLAEGLVENGEIHTMEVNEEIIALSKSFFNRSEYAGKIHQHLGDALELIPKMDYAWDIVFIDAAKNDYPAYYEMLIPKIKSGALIIADNVLWSGKVLLDKPDSETNALQVFNQMVTDDARTENVMLPIRDGLMMIRKL